MIAGTHLTHSRKKRIYQVDHGIDLTALPGAEVVRKNITGTNQETMEMTSGEEADRRLGEKIETAGTKSHGTEMRHQDIDHEAEFLLINKKSVGRATRSAISVDFAGKRIDIRTIEDVQIHSQQRVLRTLVTVMARAIIVNLTTEIPQII